MLSEQTLLAFLVPGLVLTYFFYSWFTHKDR